MGVSITLSAFSLWFLIVGTRMNWKSGILEAFLTARDYTTLPCTAVTLI